MSFKENLNKFKQALAETPQSETLRNKLWIQIGMFICMFFTMIYIYLYTNVGYILFCFIIAWVAVAIDVISLYGAYRNTKTSETAMAEMVRQQQEILAATQLNSTEVTDGKDKTIN
jgi:hypothetical protein